MKIEEIKGRREIERGIERVNRMDKIGNNIDDDDSDGM
ncbi:hypothetical protein Q7M_1243 (plasmid) [Borrelia crocidurae str. Achema]|uniref:Uncharacterized protein n=1 Tax=Borrelia crocidurae (strain Achema) TaxID=1155096 RepID=I0FEU4_BORCA|nr:hypothetical protein Q7M_1243 [Borrelia crocidurae str. Achema]